MAKLEVPLKTCLLIKINYYDLYGKWKYQPSDTIY